MKQNPWHYCVFAWSGVLGLTMFGAVPIYAGAKYVSGYTDAGGVVRGYGYTDNPNVQPAPEGMTAFVVPIAKFQDAGSGFKLQSGEVKALSQPDLDADKAAQSRIAARRKLYEARRLLDAMDEELALPGASADIQSDRDAQAAEVQSLRDALK